MKKFNRRKFLKMMGITATVGSAPFLAQSALSKTRMPKDFYNLPLQGDIRILHITDVHGQLKPIYFREPNVNLGIGSAFGRPPHLVGEKFLRKMNISPNSPKAHAYTYIDFQKHALRYGRTGGFAHLKTLLDMLRNQAGGKKNTVTIDGGDLWQGSGTSLWTRGVDMVEASNILGLDVMVGHWEFTYRENEVLSNMGLFKGDFIGQNVRVKEDALFGDDYPRMTEKYDGRGLFDEDSGHAFQPYVVKNINGVRIAIIGQAFPRTANANPQAFFPDWSFGLREDDMSDLVSQIRETESPDAVVLLSHNGMDVDIKMAERVAGLNAVFGGVEATGLALSGLIAAALKKAFNRKKSRAEKAAANASVSEAGVVNATLAAGIGTGAVSAGVVGITSSQTIPAIPVLTTPGSDNVAPPSADGFYRPTPLCETEEIIGEVLGGTINTILQGFDDAIGPVVDEVQNALGGSSTETGSDNLGVIDNAISENNVLSALSSGDLVLSISQTLADQSGVDPAKVGGANRFWADGNYGRGLVSFIDAAGQNTPTNQSLIAEALSLIDDKGNPNGIAAGLSLASNILGVNENLLTGIGNAFEAIRSGNITNLISAAGNLASFNPRILNAIAGRGAALAGAIPSGLGLGALGGMNFDIASSLNFVNSITKIFDCDPKPECSPNDTHTMQSGGGSSEKPSTSGVAESAKTTSNTVKERKSYGTSVEKSSSSREGVTIKKVFTKPQSRKTDLTNLVGFVNGKPYYGPFHLHIRDSGERVIMVGAAHTSAKHAVIYKTANESLANPFVEE